MVDHPTMRFPIPCILVLAATILRLYFIVSRGMSTKADAKVNTKNTSVKSRFSMYAVNHKCHVMDVHVPLQGSLYPRRHCVSSLINSSSFKAHITTDGHPKLIYSKHEFSKGLGSRLHSKNQTYQDKIGVLYNVKVSHKLGYMLLPSSLSHLVTFVYTLCICVKINHLLLWTKTCPLMKSNAFRSSERFQMKYKRDILGCLFKFRMKEPYSRLTIITMPFSVNQYATEIVQDNPPTETLMKYEWARYLSFKTFPHESPMTPMRLSQAGFYYTGQAEQVKCFCCGATNDRWSTEETAWQVHVRISPNCTFINGEDTDNVTIHASEYYSREYLPNIARLQIGGAGRCSSANGGPADTHSQTSTMTNSDTQRLANGDSNTQTSDTESAEGGTSRQTEAQATVSGSQAKHPMYETIEARRSSFVTWTLHDIQNPEAMVETGFFYTGVRDFVRCFYCGIGLKNWERQDSPRGEHVHWSPSCAFLQQTGSHVTCQGSEATSTGTTQSGATHSTTVNTSTSTAPDQQSASRLDTCQSNKSQDSSLAATTGATSNGEMARKREDENAGVVKANSAEENKVQNVPSGSDKSTERIKLLDENRSLRSQMTCKICLDRESNTVFLPCGHMVACRQCAQSLRKCAICRKLIRGLVNVYQS